MNLREAYQILGISETDSDVSRKRKYHRLMMLHHPDVTGDKNIYMSQRINAAYEYIKTHSKDYLSFKEPVSMWEADLNENAFFDRVVFVDYSFLDKRIPIRQVAEGKYLWDPYLEEFPMLARSVALLTSDIISEYAYMGDEAELFHLLMQDYIEPVSCARKTGTCLEEREDRVIYSFPGAVGISDVGLLRELKNKKSGFVLYAKSNENRIRIHDEDGIIYGNLSFDEDSFYYVVIPLLSEQLNGIKVELRSGKLHTVGKNLNCAGKLDISIRIEMQGMVKGTVPNHYEEIRRKLKIKNH